MCRNAPANLYIYTTIHIIHTDIHDNVISNVYYSWFYIVIVDIMQTRRTQVHDNEEIVKVTDQTAIIKDGDQQPRN